MKLSSINAETSRSRYSFRHLQSSIDCDVSAFIDEKILGNSFVSTQIEMMILR